MKVILLKEVQGLGHAGDTKEVKDGYARNFLISQGLADMLTKHSLGVLEAQRKKQNRVKGQEVRSKELQAKKINGKSFVIQVKTDDKGSLYAKVDAKTIAGELQKQGYAIEVDEVVLDQAIKKAGEYEVELKLSGEKAKIKINISNKNNEKKEDSNYKK